LKANPPEALIATVYVADRPALTVTLVGAAGGHGEVWSWTKEKFKTLFRRSDGVGSSPPLRTPDAGSEGRAGPIQS